MAACDAAVRRGVGRPPDPIPTALDPAAGLVADDVSWASAEIEIQSDAMMQIDRCNELKDMGSDLDVFLELTEFADDSPIADHHSPIEPVISSINKFDNSAFGGIGMRARAHKASIAIAGILLLAVDSASAAACDRRCLRATTEKYLAALVKNDPGKAPLAKSIRYTENAVDVKPGDGLWKSTTRLGAFQRIYVDAVQGQAAYFGLIE